MMRQLCTELEAVLCALTQVSSIWSHLSNFAHQRGYFGVQGKGY